MPRLTHFWKAINGDEDGQVLVEYGLILALIALVAFAGLTTMSGGVDGMYTTIRQIVDAMAGALGG